MRLLILLLMLLLTAGIVWAEGVDVVLRICQEDWVCTPWSEGVCGTRNCHDRNSCGSIEEKPLLEKECDVDLTVNTRRRNNDFFLYRIPEQEEPSEMEEAGPEQIFRWLNITINASHVQNFTIRIGNVGNTTKNFNLTVNDSRIRLDTDAIEVGPGEENDVGVGIGPLYGKAFVPAMIRFASEDIELDLEFNVRVKDVVVEEDSPRAVDIADTEDGTESIAVVLLLLVSLGGFFFLFTSHLTRG